MLRTTHTFTSVGFLAASLLAFVLLGGLPAGEGLAAGAAEGVRVIRVNDGDTLTVLDGRRHRKVRLIGIDAPELGQRPWGDRARAHLERLVAGAGWTVTLEPDIDRIDKYGRSLAYVRTADGRLVNEEMLRSGNAVLFTFPPNVRYVGRLTEAQREARRKRIGIWERGGLDERPADWRRSHPRQR